MDGHDGNSARVLSFVSRSEQARERERDRMRRTLERLADVLGRPVADFFPADAETRTVSTVAVVPIRVEGLDRDDQG